MKPGHFDIFEDAQDFENIHTKQKKQLRCLILNIYTTSFYELKAATLKNIVKNH